MSNAERRRQDDRRFEARVTGRLNAALPKLIADVARETTTSTIASRIATGFVVALGARAARVYLTHGDRATLDLVAADATDTLTLARIHAERIEDDLPAAVAMRVGLLQLMDACDASPAGRPCLAGDGAGTRRRVALALPLFARGATIGVVSAVFDEIGPRERETLSPLSTSFGALLDGARLRSEVAHLEERARLCEERMQLVVHELRQPLSMLLLSASLLTKRSLDDEQRSLERLRAAGLRLDAIISDLCDASFLESGNFALHLACTDVLELVESCVERLAPGAQVSVDGGVPLIDIDPQRIEQVLTNLLVNAQKHGRAGTAPHVVVARRDHGVVVSVTNEGGGISNDERTKVFEPYYRGRDRKPGTPGHGLGLYICKRLVEEHGGRIWNDGSATYTRFSFTLPLPNVPRVSETRVVAVPPCADEDET